MAPLTKCFLAVLSISHFIKCAETFSSRAPTTFRFAPNGVCVQPQFFVDEATQAKFTMRNVPGEGDCMFLAVALAVATSMGLGGNNALLQAISQETRRVVAEVLRSSGNLYIADGRLCPAQDLLKQATREEGLDDTDKYLELLRKEGSQGGIQGGGPELTVLANVLRRPISIYELAPKPQQKNGEGKEGISIDVNGASSSQNIICKGTFGTDLFSDPCATIPDSAVLSNIQPGAYSWQLHILVLDTSRTEKHACVLLPQTPI
jgi:hypothetical protein